MTKGSARGPVPSHDTMMWPILLSVSELGGSGSISEINDAVIKRQRYSEALQAVLHNDGPQTKIDYRLAWARSPMYGQVDGFVGQPEACRVTHVAGSPAGCSGPSRRNSKCWVRLRMVGSTFCGSVVARTKTTWAGGSSRVLSRAFEAAAVSMWTSSMM